MICIIAGNYPEAAQWARGQNLDRSEWFYPESPESLISWTNFHVLVIGTAGMNVPTSYFNRVYETAKQRGRIGRL